MFSFFQRRPSVRKLLPAGIDAHCHLLPGVDDGAENMESSLEIIRAQQALGLRGAICTPHIMARYPDNTPANLRRVFEQLVTAASQTLQIQNSKSKIQNSGFRLHLAAEYMLDESFTSLLEQPDQLLTIPANLLDGTAAESQGNNEGKVGVIVNSASVSEPNSINSKSKIQNPKSAPAVQEYVLIELPQYLLPEGWLDVLDSIRACGLRPLLAHPERYLRLLSESDLVDLHARGLRYQGNLGSLAGLYGPQVQRLARRLHKSGLYTTFGTDAHSAGMITKMDLAA